MLQINYLLLLNPTGIRKTILALKNIMGQTNSTADGSTEQQWDIDSTPVELVLQVCGAADLRPH